MTSLRATAFAPGPGVSNLRSSENGGEIRETTGLLRVCGHRGCTTWTLGGPCVEHEKAAPERSWPRGRPYRAPAVPAPRLEAVPSAVRT